MDREKYGKITNIVVSGKKPRCRGRTQDYTAISSLLYKSSTYLMLMTASRRMLNDAAWRFHMLPFQTHVTCSACVGRHWRSVSWKKDSRGSRLRMADDDDGSDWHVVSLQFPCNCLTCLMDLDVHGICASAADDDDDDVNDVITWCTWCTGCSWTKVTDGNTEMKQMKYAPLCTFTSAHTRQEQSCHIMRTHTVLILFATNGIPSGWSDIYWDTETVAVYSWRMIWQLCFIMFSILLLLSHPSSLRSLSLGLDFKYVAILWCQLQATYWVVL